MNISETSICEKLLCLKAVKLKNESYDYSNEKFM